MQYYIVFSIVGNDINEVLSKQPDKYHVTKLLAQNAYKYKKLALALDIDDGFVEGLKCNDDDIVNLDKVIRQWIQTQCSPVTWNTIIKSVESPIFGKNLDLGVRIRNWLKEDEHFAYYMKKDN